MELPFQLHVIIHRNLDSMISVLNAIITHEEMRNKLQSCKNFSSGNLQTSFNFSLVYQNSKTSLTCTEMFDVCVTTSGRPVVASCWINLILQIFELTQELYMKVLLNILDFYAFQITTIDNYISIILLVWKKKEFELMQQHSYLYCQNRALPMFFLDCIIIKMPLRNQIIQKNVM